MRASWALGEVGGHAMPRPRMGPRVSRSAEQCGGKGMARSKPGVCQEEQEVAVRLFLVVPVVVAWDQGEERPFPPHRLAILQRFVAAGEVSGVDYEYGRDNSPRACWRLTRSAIPLHCLRVLS